MLNTMFIHLDKVSSTINYAKNFIKDYPRIDNNIIITANMQSNGVGKLNRVWVSPKGNLYLTAIFKPFFLNSWKTINSINIFNLLVTLSVLQCIKDILGDTKYTIYCKWPNDILLNERKISGILLENISTAMNELLLVSIGLNIKHAPELTGRYKAISLADLGNFNFNAEDISYKLIKKIYSNVYNLNKDDIINEWLKYAYKLNNVISLTIGNKTKKGIFKGINANGLLLLKTNTNYVETISTGEIY